MRKKVGNIRQTSKNILRQTNQIRRTVYNGELYFATSDLIQVTIGSVNPQQYYNKMKLRNLEFANTISKYENILPIKVENRSYRMRFISREGILKVEKELHSLVKPQKQHNLRQFFKEIISENPDFLDELKSEKRKRLEQIVNEDFEEYSEVFKALA